MAGEFTSIFAVAAILWTAIILYLIYLDSKLRAVESKLEKKG